ncbi:sigma-70 family RNA polymerase sigma factor [Hyphomicrobium sp. 1Nfss2.1]|uniref:sigma-70 family RNA polymerase sigma factor n=1 Tax=Hyphomicrobium sp. 1Nfss2.1 TaxID=3413936 RepID=UPI003C7DCE48
MRYGWDKNNLASMRRAISVEQFEAEVVAHRQLLFRLAMVQLQEPASAEDVVQETILAALLAREKFKRESSIRTWLISIMRYKVIDALRARSRYVGAQPAVAAEECDEGAFDRLFDANGCWKDAKDAWSDPHSAAEQTAFFRILEACLARLPERTSRAFMMREWLEMEPGEIQSLLNVTPTNLRALLYRARMQLRLCMDLNWER